MDRSRPLFARSLLPLLGVTALAGIAAVSGVAHADGPDPNPVPSFAPELGMNGKTEDNWTDESSWDVPGEYVIDARDDVSDSDLADIASKFDLVLRPTQLERETRIERTRMDAGKALRVVR